MKNSTAKNPELESLGTFKADTLPIATLGKNTPAAQMLLWVGLAVQLVIGSGAWVLVTKAAGE